MVYRFELKNKKEVFNMNKNDKIKIIQEDFKLNAR